MSIEVFRISFDRTLQVRQRLLDASKADQRLPDSAVRQRFPFIVHIYLEADVVRASPRNIDPAYFPGGYQAGVSDEGYADQITLNAICGVAYTPVTPPPYLSQIDIAATNPVVNGNR